MLWCDCSGTLIMRSLTSPSECTSSDPLTCVATHRYADEAYGESGGYADVHGAETADGFGDDDADGYMDLPVEQ